MDEKLKRLIPFLESRTGPAIVYVTLQQHAQDVADALNKHKMGAMVYHAGLPAEEREQIQNDFMDSERGIVCATIAFGMGIDKGLYLYLQTRHSDADNMILANIRQVVHLFMPKTIEGYSQEVGRAGRDGLLSTCLLFLSAADIPVLEGFCRGDTCHKESLQLWLQEVAMKEPARDGT